MMFTDKIVLEKLKFFAYHGVFESEKQQGQDFYITATLELDYTGAALSDDLQDTVNYGEVYELIKDTTVNQRFDLLEALGYTIIKRLLEAFPQLQAVEVRVDKPMAPGREGPFPATCIMRRTRQDLELENKKAFRAVIALGSNIGDTLANLKEAVSCLEQYGCRILKKSRLYKTEPWGYKDQDDFLNGAVLVETNETPLELIRTTQRIEKEMGRRKEFLNGPRNIDLDILLYDNRTVNTEYLEIPHPRLTQRLFVLQPLMDIAPDMEIPGYGIVKKVYDSYQGSERVELTELEL